MKEIVGTDINAVFGHQITFPPPESLPLKMREGIRCKDGPIANDWQWDRGHSEPSLYRIFDTELLSVYIGPHCGLITSGVSWLLASEDTEYRRPVTSAIAAVARFFRSPGLLYLPDDLEPWDDADIWISGGITFTELQQKLLRIRLPSPDFSGAIHCSENRFWIDGYVVENINDACPIGQAAQGM